MSYEDYFLNQIDAGLNFNPKSLLQDEDRIRWYLEKKKEVVDVYRPRLEDFIGKVDKRTGVPYSLEEIQKDQMEVAKLKKIFYQEHLEKSDKTKALFKVSQIYEGVIIDQAEANAWFGENCEVIPTSDYDDYKNGIDGIGVFRDKIEARERYFGFGIDITFASDNKILLDKLNSIKAVIRKNALNPESNPLPIAKYVVDEEGNYTSLLVPKVIIGSRYASAEKLIRLWGSNKEGRNKELQIHPVQSKIIMETLWQALYFHKFAAKLKNNDAAYAYGKLYHTFSEIFKEKKELIEEHWDEIQDDVVFETIRDYTGNGED